MLRLQSHRSRVELRDSLQRAPARTTRPFEHTNLLSHGDHRDLQV